jgi:hypothetical protein
MLPSNRAGEAVGAQEFYRQPRNGYEGTCDVECDAPIKRKERELNCMKSWIIDAEIQEKCATEPKRNGDTSG